MPDAILSSDDLKLLEEGLQLAKQLRLELQRARQAGLDVTDIEQQLTQAENQLRTLVRVYGPRRGR